MRRFISFLMGVLLLTAKLGGALPGFADELKIVAVVNDEVITQADLERAFLPVYLQLQSEYQPEDLAAKIPELRQKVLLQLIDERLMLQEARKPKPVEVSKGKIGTPPPIEVSPAEVDELVSKVTSQFDDPGQLASSLKQQGLTLEDLKVRYRDQMTVQKLIDREIRSRVSISPAEVTSYFSSHQTEFQLPAAVQVATILIKPKGTLDLLQAQSLAQDIHSQILQGSDFYELAARYSDGPNAKMGGRIGFLEQGKTLKEIDPVLFSLKVGEISPVIKTSVGFHLFRVESARPARQASLEEAKDRIQDRLFQEKMGARYREWMDKLKASAYVSIQ